MSQYGRTEELLRKLSGDPNITSQLSLSRVALVIAPQAVATPQLQLTAMFCLNLLARLFPVVGVLHVFLPQDSPLHIRLPRWQEETLGRSIVKFLSDLEPPASCGIFSSLPDNSYDAVVVLGDLKIQSAIYVGSHGWIAELSMLEPVYTRGQVNPVGAHIAGVLAAAEVWKRVLASSAHLFHGVPIVPTKERLTFSGYDYSHHADGPNPELPATVSLSKMTMVGVGAGGGATAYTLAALQDVSGDITVIEPDIVSDTNLNRLVMATAVDVANKRFKGEIVNELFKFHSQLQVRPLLMPFDTARTLLSIEELRRVSAAVHSRTARRTIQLETPEIIWDAAATETGEFFVWRVAFGVSPCIGCRLAIEKVDPEAAKASQLSMTLGLTKETWLRKIRDNEPFTDEEVILIMPRMANAGEGVRTPQSGQYFGDWEAEQCGKMTLPEGDDEIPIPFAPVMAGTLIAGEILKENLFPLSVLDSYYWNTLLGVFMVRNRPQRPVLLPGCPFCSKDVFLAQFRRMWVGPKKSDD